MRIVSRFLAILLTSLPSTVFTASGQKALSQLIVNDRAYLVLFEEIVGPGAALLRGVLRLEHSDVSGGLVGFLRLKKFLRLIQVLIRIDYLLIVTLACHLINGNIDGLGGCLSVPSLDARTHIVQVVVELRCEDESILGHFMRDCCFDQI